jgi:GAF domain-containing protein
MHGLEKVSGLEMRFLQQVSLQRLFCVIDVLSLYIDDWACTCKIKNSFFERFKMPNQFVVATSDASSNTLALTITDLLRDARTLLEMDIVFVSEFAEGQRVIRWVDKAANAEDTIKVGQSNLLEETYCQRVVDGRLPMAIPDAHLLPEAEKLEVTKSHKIRTYLAVPIFLSSGQIFGTLCCISHQPRTALGNRQIDALRIVAERVAVELQKHLTSI